MPTGTFTLAALCVQYEICNFNLSSALMVPSLGDSIKFSVSDYFLHVFKFMSFHFICLCSYNIMI